MARLFSLDLIYDPLKCIIIEKQENLNNAIISEIFTIPLKLNHFIFYFFVLFIFKIVIST